MRVSQRNSVDSRPKSSVWREIAWFQLVFLVASFLIGWGITGYTDFSWPLVIGAAIYVFIVGNLIVAPFYAVVFHWRGGGLISQVLAAGIGGPMAWLAVSFANKSIAQGSVVDANTGEPVDLFAGALDWTVVTNLLLTAGTGIVAVLVVWLLRLVLGKITRDTA